MTPRSLLSIASGSLILMAVGNPTAAAERAAATFRVPRDRHQPLIELDFIDAASATDRQRRPELTIFVDGAVQVAQQPGSNRTLTGRMPADELQRLIRELLVTRDLLGCRTDDLSRQITAVRRARRRPAPPPDAAVTMVRMHGEGGTHEVRCHGLGMTANQFPDLTAVQDLFACQQRLENVIAVIRAGGYDAIQPVLSAANRHLQHRVPSAEPLTARDLTMVDVRGDGSRYLQFSRVASAPTAATPADGLPPLERFLIVSVSQRPGRSPEISITAN